MKKYIFLFLLLPNLVFAKMLIASGDNIGISVKTSGVIVSGFYKNSSLSNDFRIGDRIISINDKYIGEVKDLKKYINSDFIKFGLIRDGKMMYINSKIDDNYTGLLVRDSVSGIGTLTYIDPETLTFGALGHEIGDGNNGIFYTKSGNIYSSSVTSIKKGIKGNVGEKNAKIDYNLSIGDIKVNDNTGIYGKYKGRIDGELIETLGINDVKVGKASIITVLDGKEKKSYDIYIMDIDNKSLTRNFKIKIIDEELLSITGGIVKGMSGSPIIQDNKLVGAVTHTIVDFPNMGYGISIDNMIKE